MDELEKRAREFAAAFEWSHQLSLQEHLEYGYRAGYIAGAKDERARMLSDAELSVSARAIYEALNPTAMAIWDDCLVADERTVARYRKAAIASDTALMAHRAKEGG